MFIEKMGNTKANDAFYLGRANFISKYQLLRQIFELDFMENIIIFWIDL